MITADVVHPWQGCRMLRYVFIPSQKPPMEAHRQNSCIFSLGQHCVPVEVRSLNYVAAIPSV